MWTAVFVTANSREEGMRMFFVWLNEWPLFTQFTIEFCFIQKSTFEFIAISFLFFRAITLIRIWFRKVSLYGLFAFWYLMITLTIECFIFSLFIIDYLVIIFLTCWYIFISFSSFEYFSSITLCSFRRVLFRDFYFLFRIEERV